MLHQTNLVEGYVVMQPTATSGLQASHFEPTISNKPGQSTLVLTFPIDAAPNFVIYEGMEIWAGWWDDSTGHWVGAQTPFGGYILKQTGGSWGGEHTLVCDLVDYGRLLDRKYVRGWPSPVTVDPPVGWPPGHSVSEWLYGSIAGGSFADGLIPSYLAGVGPPSIDDVFDTLIFDVYRPGNSRPDTVTEMGQFYWIKLGDAITAITDACQLVYPDVRVGTWLQATALGTHIVPCFHYHNTAVPEAPPVHTYASDPDLGAGELYIEQPFTHERDWRECAPSVIVVGTGGDPTITGNPLVYAVAQDPRGMLAYPTKYYREPGWEALYVVPQVGLISQAQQIADAIAPQTGGARGILAWYTRTPEVPGTWIWLRETVETLNRAYRINEVGIEANRYKVVVGEVPLDVADILRAGTTDAFLLGTGGTLPGVSGRRRQGLPMATRESTSPVVQGPMVTAQNVIQPQFWDVTAHTVQASGAVRPNADGSIPPTPAAPTTDLVQHKDVLGQVRLRADRDGVGHPLHWGSNYTAAGQVAKWQAPDPGRFVRLLVHPATGSVTVTKNGASASVPFSFVRGDLVRCTSGGTGYDAADPLIVTLSEAPTIVEPYP